ncbi:MULTISPECIES: C40 family peptidase [Lysinibacillus]|uniref:NlpC/P60 family protein n=1 Tax=Lysinibacillus antri TaxID=2498145 RepID=A0A432LD37_9BACI|nr:MULTISPECIES: C40 family peptidase [Lysinibacillus]RUL54165.1 NlpC/P60 family protein [Lysinibacillus antri]TSI07347.1 NlpC/P60 family protein [Lysinibacillus sp. BW-2-10]
MKYSKHIRQFVLASIAGFAIYFSPIVTENTYAAEEEITSAELQETAKQYLGVPYRYGGTSTSGFDCSGFVLTVYKGLGVNLPRTSSSMYNVGDKVAKEDLQPGDLVFFNTSGRGISHVGIYYGNGKFIHSQTGQGVSITDINDKWYWGDRYVGAKRVSDIQLVAKN